MRLATLFILGWAGVSALARNLGQIPPLPPETRRLPLGNRAETAIPTLAPSSAASSNGSSASLTSTSTVSLPLPPTTVPTTLPFPTPTPLDTALSYSLSSPCLMYLTSLLSTSEFLACLPFSLLLHTSSAYSDLVSAALTSSNYTDLDLFLAYASSPQPSAETCDAYMANVSSAITGKKACAADLASRKPNVVALEAKVGFANYQVMREAAGLTDGATGRYCYLDAVASDGPDDLYLWNLAAGLPLPSTSTPTCSSCSEQLLNHLAANVGPDSALNGTIIEQARGVINNACGATFVTDAATSGSNLIAGRSGVWMWALLGLGLSVLCAGGVL